MNISKLTFSYFFDIDEVIDINGFKGSFCDIFEMGDLLFFVFLGFFDDLFKGYSSDGFKEDCIGDFC